MRVRTMQLCARSVRVYGRPAGFHCVCDVWSTCCTGRKLDELQKYLGKTSGMRIALFNFV